MDAVIAKNDREYGIKVPATGYWRLTDGLRGCNNDDAEQQC